MEDVWKDLDRVGLWFVVVKYFTFAVNEELGEVPWYCFTLELRIVSQILPYWVSVWTVHFSLLHHWEVDAVFGLEPHDVRVDKGLLFTEFVARIPNNLQAILLIALVDCL